MRIKILTAFLLMVSLVTAGSREGYNAISTSYIGGTRDMDIIRVINGGSVIIPSFDESCPECMKSAFSFACKIMEEYLPPCLPIYVNVSCGTLSGSARTSISKVTTITKENFGLDTDLKCVPMATIKGVLLGEYIKGSNITYFPNINDMSMLTQDADISIKYNESLLPDISFSLDSDPGEKYDFVSIVLRDLLIGFGFSHTYRYNPTANTLINPAQEMVPYEKIIDDALGNKQNQSMRLKLATSGELVIKRDALRSIKLYAPTTWIDKVSLNYFIPQQDCSISNILSYNFGKGTVSRSLNDDYGDWLFRNFLGWYINYTTGSSSYSTSSNGSTDNLIPYKGSIEFQNTFKSIGINRETNPSTVSNVSSVNNYVNEDLDNYLQKFHPLGEAKKSDNCNKAFCVGLLLKDGTWDTVESYVEYIPSAINMNTWQFHYTDEEYARSADGYLRARISVMEKTDTQLGRQNSIKTSYYVVNYLPQAITLNVENNSTYLTSIQYANSSSSMPVRLYLGNLEGITRVVIEKLREGMRLPTKTDLSDFKKGYYDTTIDRNTTFTAIGYNANGSKRGIPITIEYNTTTSNQLSCKYSNGEISIQSMSEGVTDIEYIVQGISGTNMTFSISGESDGVIDINSMPDGFYVVKVFDKETKETHYFKIKK